MAVNTTALKYCDLIATEGLANSVGSLVTMKLEGFTFFSKQSVTEKVINGRFMKN